MDFHVLRCEVIELEELLEKKTFNGLIKKRKRKDDGRIIIYYSRTEGGEGE